MNNYNFMCLQDASKLHLMLIWLLASQMDNKIPADEDFIRNRIGIKGKVNLKDLINNGFLIDDSNALAECKQVAMLETEAETYSKETEAEKIKKKSIKKEKVSLDELSINHIQDWLTKKRVAGKFLTIDEHELLETFKDYSFRVCVSV